MSQENVEVVRSIYAGWSTNDPATLGFIDPLIEVHPDPRSDWPGIEATYQGHEGLTDISGPSSMPSANTGPKPRTCWTRATGSSHSPSSEPAASRAVFRS